MRKTATTGRWAYKIEQWACASSCRFRRAYLYSERKCDNIKYKMTASCSAMTGASAFTREKETEAGKTPA
jgi:hypothetical protein